MHPIMQAFLDARSARDLSPRTIHGYRQQLSRLFEATSGALPADPRPLEEFLAGLDVSRNTRRNYHRTLSALFQFASVRYGEPNPMAVIDAPKRERKVKPRPTIDQVRLMLEAAPNIRDAIMLTLLFDTGCRVGEVVTITAEDVHGELLRIPRGKTGQRWVPTPPELPRLMKAAGITRGLLVANLRNGNPLTVNAAERAYKRIAKAAGLPVEMQSPHSARRFAAGEINRRRGVAAAMTVLGHRDIRTTMEYLDTTIEAVLPGWAEDRPLAGLSNSRAIAAASAGRVHLRFKFEDFEHFSVRQLARLIGVSHGQVHGAKVGRFGIGPKFISGALRAFPDKSFWELFEDLGKTSSNQIA